MDHLSHGGNRRALAAAAGRAEAELLDYSANINPFGPPPWLAAALERAAARVSVYPDPEASTARAAAAARFGRPPEEFVFADGAEALIFAAPRALGARRCLIPLPSYSSYRRAARSSGAAELLLPLDPERDFALADPAFLTSLRESLGSSLPGRGAGCLVFLGAPNNPAGGSLPRALVEELAATFPEARFLVDESFLDLSRSGESLLGTDAPNLAIVVSLTKTWAVPGARIGYLWAPRPLAEAFRAELPSWPLSCFAEEIAVRALEDEDFAPRSRRALLAEEGQLVAGLSALPGLRVIRSGANFLLLDLLDEKRGTELADALLAVGIAVRRFGMGEGLTSRYVRIAVRSRGENDQLLDILGRMPALGGGR